MSDETVTGGIQRNELMNQVLIDVEKDIADKAEYAGIMQMLNDKLLMVKFADSCGESLRAMVAGVKPTLDQFVDWHIAAEPTHYNQTLSHCGSEHEEWQILLGCFCQYVQSRILPFIKQMLKQHSYKHL